MNGADSRFYTPELRHYCWKTKFLYFISGSNFLKLCSVFFSSICFTFYVIACVHVRVCVCVCLHVNVSAPGDQKGASALLEHLQAVSSPPPIWVLGTELWLSAGAVHMLSLHSSVLICNTSVFLNFSSEWFFSMDAFLLFSFLNSTKPC